MRTLSRKSGSQDAIREEHVDLFVVAGHVPVRDSAEFDAVYDAIRSVRWDTPIQFFGGHTHIRDYRKWDNKAYGLESGRYMETISFTSISGLKTGRRNDIGFARGPNYARRYIDNNLFSMHHHTGLNATTFPTGLGRNVSAQIFDARKTLNLDKAYGCAPHTYWLNRAPYPSDENILTWLEGSVLPDTANASTHATKPTMIITNTGAMRFDIFEGPFTIDSTFLVSPFTSGFKVISGVPHKAAAQVLRLLNNEGQILLSDLMELGAQHAGLGQLETRMLHRLAPPVPPVGHLTQAAPPIYESRDQKVFAGVQKFLLETPNSKLTPGYTTTDDAGSDGEDTVHAPIRFYDVPNCVQADFRLGDKDSPAPDSVDLVYNEFIEKWILLALRYLGVTYTVDDTSYTFDGKTLTEVISDWVHENWACK